MDDRYTGPVHLTLKPDVFYTVWRCRDCGALINGKFTHDEWHARYEQVADDARWGGLNRPIGGPAF